MALALGSRGGWGRVEAWETMLSEGGGAGGSRGRGGRAEGRGHRRGS